MTAVSLWRNRDFMLLQAGHLLSSLGGQLTTLAFPLLVLALTGSPAKVGLVTFVSILPYPLFTVLAGVAVDRWNRKWLMVGADLVGFVSVGLLAGAIVFDRLAFWQIVA